MAFSIAIYVGPSWIYPLLYVLAFRGLSLFYFHLFDLGTSVLVTFMHFQSLVPGTLLSLCSIVENSSNKQNNEIHE